MDSRSRTRWQKESAVRKCVRFEFPYMAARRTSGKCHAPDREAALIGSRLSVLAKLGKLRRFVIGGITRPKFGATYTSLVPAHAASPVMGAVLPMKYRLYTHGWPPHGRDPSQENYAVRFQLAFNLIVKQSENLSNSASPYSAFRSQ
jgi:predicted alpha/beta-hydrolase family hydrolase